MKKSLFVLGMASMLALTGCHGTKKVEFSEFKEKADAALKEAPKVDYLKISGKVGETKIKFATNQSLGSYSLDEAGVATYVASIGSVDSMYGYGLSDKAEFYVGLGFKVVYSEAKYEYTTKGYLASVKGKIDGTEYSLSVKQVFAK